MNFYPGQCFGYKKIFIPIQTQLKGKPIESTIETYSDYWLIINIDINKTTYCWIRYIGNPMCGRHSVGYVTHDIKNLQALIKNGLLELIDFIPENITQ